MGRNLPETDADFLTKLDGCFEQCKRDVLEQARNLLPDVDERTPEERIEADGVAECCFRVVWSTFIHVRDLLGDAEARRIFLEVSTPDGKAVEKWKLQQLLLVTIERYRLPVRKVAKVLAKNSGAQRKYGLSGTDNEGSLERLLRKLREKEQARRLP